MLENPNVYTCFGAKIVSLDDIIRPRKNWRMVFAMKDDIIYESRILSLPHFSPTLSHPPYPYVMG